MGANVFGYGTLISMHYRDSPVVVEVEGFKRVYSPHPAYGFDYPFVMKKPGNKLRGILLAGVSPSRLERLDFYEGVPRLYERVEVPVDIIANKAFLPLDGPVVAWIYVPSPRTLSLDLDRAFKEVRRQDIEAYQAMMDRDLWLERLASDQPGIKEALPELFPSGMLVGGEPVPRQPCD